MVSVSIVIVIFITGYAFADITSFPDTENDPICKRDLWLYLRANSLAIVVMLVILGHMAVCEMNKIARARGIEKMDFSLLWISLYINIACEIVCGV